MGKAATKIVKTETEDVKLIEEYISEGKLKAELTELFSKIFLEECFAGVDIRMNQTPIRISISVLNPAQAIGENKMKVKQLQSMIAQRISVPTSSVNVIFEKIEDKRLEPAYHAEELRKAFINTKPYKKVVNSVFKQVISAGGQGVCIRIAGKVKGQRAKATKHTKGLLIQAGKPAKNYIKKAKTSALCRSGVIGIQVSVMLPYDPEGVRGPSSIITDKITVYEPKKVEE